jgi:hypothetical protein
VSTLRRDVAAVAHAVDEQEVGPDVVEERQGAHVGRRLVDPPRLAVEGGVALEQALHERAERPHRIGGEPAEQHLGGLEGGGPVEQDVVRAVQVPLVVPLVVRPQRKRRRPPVHDRPDGRGHLGERPAAQQLAGDLQHEVGLVDRAQHLVGAEQVDGQRGARAPSAPDEEWTRPHATLLAPLRPGGQVG